MRCSSEEERAVEVTRQVLLRTVRLTNVNLSKFTLGKNFIEDLLRALTNWWTSEVDMAS